MSRDNMQRSCDNCKYFNNPCRLASFEEGCCGPTFDTSKDYCSKYSKKEQTTLKDIKDILKSNRTANQKSCVVEHYFKQRIEESRRDLREEIREYGPERTEDLLSNIGEYKHLFDKAFKWILD